MNEPYRPIADYAIIGDCRSAALISKAGSIDWLCLPRFDSASAFAAVLDARRGGRFLVAPSEPSRATRRYIGQSNVLETTFQTSTGTLRLTDVMPVADERTKAQELWPEHEVLRRVEVLDGQVEVRVRYEPRLDFGRTPATFLPGARQALLTEHGPAVLALRSEIPLQTIDHDCAAEGRETLGAGDRRFVSLSYTHGLPAVLPALGERANRLIDDSVRWWESWASQCHYDWHYRDAVVRSALTLKLLTYAPSGAVVAAPTTSLPEEIGGVRNWDYRYCWLRDAALTLRALMDLGFGGEGEAFLSWLMHATRLTQPRLQVVYDVYGEGRLPESTLAHFEGYAGSAPVRIGNGASEQLQLDVYGDVLDAAYQYVIRGGRLDASTGRVLVKLGQTVCDTWQQPDEGIWEPRSGRQHHTHSKAMCWVALDRLVRLDETGHLDAPEKHYARIRDDIRDAIESRAWNDRLGSYVATFDGDDVDASLLRMAFCGYADPRGPQMKGTAARVLERLGAGRGLLYRYLAEDGLAGREGAFGICSFWGAECCALEGRQDDAIRWFESLLGFANDVGLLAEEIDPASGALLGNFPQGFTHVGLINAALTLAECAGHSQTGAAVPKPGEEGVREGARL